MRIPKVLAAVVAVVALAGCGARETRSSASAGGQAAGAGSRPESGRPGNPGTAGRFAAINVQAVSVKVGPLMTSNDTAGTVVPVTQSQVAAQVAGVVSSVAKKAGDTVKKGDVVVQLDDAQLRLAVSNAQAALQNAKINLTVGQQTASGSGPKLQNQLKAAQNALAAAQKTYDSQKATFDLGGISASALDNAQSQLENARANVEAAQLALDQNQQSDTQAVAQLQLAVDQAANQLQSARLNLRYASITAPFTGQIAAVNVSEGMYVSLNTSVFQLVSADKQINFTVPPSDASRLRRGDTVNFLLGGLTYSVKIIQSPSAPINGVVPMVASVPAAAPVPYGAVGTISYDVTLATGPLVPITALQTRANENYVDVIVDGKAVEKPIVIVAETGTSAVARGVSAGDEVIINPPPGLLAGSSVNVVTLPAQGATP